MGSREHKSSYVGLIFLLCLPVGTEILTLEIVRSKLLLLKRPTISQFFQFTLFAGYVYLIIQLLPLKVILVFVVILQSFSLFLLATEIQTYSSSSSGRFENVPGDSCAILLSNRNLQKKVILMYFITTTIYMLQICIFLKL